MKDRADKVLFKEGYFKDLKKAKTSIMLGLVYIDQVRIEKPGDIINYDSNIIIKNHEMKYVSRGGFKLEKVITKYNLDFKKTINLDVGSSTGGFTDCMLQNGSEKVVALDVGYGQLDWKLREDKRVIVMERTNFRTIESNFFLEKFDFITIDVSFISLELILPNAKMFLKKTGKIIALIKPQFEANKLDVGENGVVKDKLVHLKVLTKINSLLNELELYMEEITYSPITGAKGNIEYIALISSNYNTVENNFKNVINEAHAKLN